MEIRRLDESDVPAAARVAYAALPVPAEFDDGDRVPWLERRTAHFVATDPAGSFVAEDDGEIVGMANAIVRDGIWGLSLMAVHPDRHARGTGTELLRATLACAEGARGQIIMSSQDPRAMRMYARAGFDLHPAVGLAGILDRSALPDGLKARPSDDLEAAAASARAVRGGAYGPGDLGLLTSSEGRGLLAVDGRGFVVHLRGSPIVLVADSDGIATDLLWAALAEAPRGGSVHVDCLTSGQDWAVRVGLAAGLALSPEGPLFTRGQLGPLRPFVPSGAIL